MDTKSLTERDHALTPTEHAIATLWQQALDAPLLPGPADDFFELGGDSIAMVTALALIQEEFSIALPEDALFTAPSLRELSSAVDAALSDQPIAGT